MGNAAKCVLTVGHSHHELPRFLELLRLAGLRTVADVRSQPVSRRHPHFSRPELEPALKASGIAYVFLGDLLGGRPSQPSLYDDEGRVDYERLRATESFQRGLERICQRQESHHIALLCAEEDPLDCHRGLMIAPALVERGIRPAHLRGDGRIESMTEMEDRLLTLTKLDGLFTLSAEDRRAALEEAYRVMARRKAFRLRPDATEEEQ
jgi:uncharacterized protein (DUF488 family)